MLDALTTPIVIVTAVALLTAIFFVIAHMFSIERMLAGRTDRFDAIDRQLATNRAHIDELRNGKITMRAAEIETDRIRTTEVTAKVIKVEEGKLP